VAGINVEAGISFTGSVSGDLGDVGSAGGGGGGGGEVGFLVDVVVDTSGFPVKRDDDPKLRVPTGAEFDAEATRFRFRGLEGLDVGVPLSSAATLFSTEALGVVSSPPSLDGVKTLPWAGDPFVARFAFILSHFLFSARSFHFPLYLLDDEATTGGGPPVSMLRRRPSSMVMRREKDSLMHVSVHLVLSLAIYLRLWAKLKSLFCFSRQIVLCIISAVIQDIVGLPGLNWVLFDILKPSTTSIACKNSWLVMNSLVLFSLKFSLPRSLIRKLEIPNQAEQVRNFWQNEGHQISLQKNHFLLNLST
jgi:hypothetical protein